MASAAAAPADLLEYESAILDEISKRYIGGLAQARAALDSLLLFKSGIAEANRPIGCFLYAGPTGSGKTSLVQAFSAAVQKAEHKQGSVQPEPLVRIDCGEFQHAHEVAKLIGAPPGYIGYNESKPRLNAELFLKQGPISFLLLDELEKANLALWNIMLGIMDTGSFVLGMGHRVDFTKTMIFATSNCGARAAAKGAKFGLTASTTENSESVFQGEIRKTFPAEFLNRFDGVSIFPQLTPDDIRGICQLQLKKLQERLAEKRLVLVVDDSAIDLLSADGYDPKYGARHLQRVIRRKLEVPLARHLLKKGLPTASIGAYAEDSSLMLKPL